MAKSEASETTVFLLHKAPFAMNAANAAPERQPTEVPKDFVPTAESAHDLYQLDLPTFAGPLDLLLFLIKRHTIDVFDIPISFICERYLECLQLMEEMSIDVASEFMLVAAELLHIKSRMLLPKEDEVEELDETDPRADLVARLLEYQKYQAAAGDLDQLDRLGRDVFDRRPEPVPDAVGPPALREVSIFALVHAFNKVLKRQAPEVRHQVVVEQISVRKRMHMVVDALGAGNRMAFVLLLAGVRDRLEVVVSFLAVLELTKMRLLRVMESEEGELFLEARFETVDEAISLLQGLGRDVDEQFA